MTLSIELQHNYLSLSPIYPLVFLIVLDSLVLINCTDP